MSARRAQAVPGVVALLLLAGPAWAHTAGATQPGVPPDVSFDQRLGATVPLDGTFRSDDDQATTLRAAMAGRPAVLVMLYYKCTMLCPLLLDGMVRGLRELSFTAGREYQVIAVSINPKETPAIAAAKKRETLQRYSRPGAERGWSFLTGDEAAIRPLADAVGFRYAYDARHDEYAHPAGLVLLTADGRVARYFYGVEFPERDLRLGLVEAAQNRIGSPIDKVLLLCYHYDPLTGKYGLVIMNVIRLAGSATVVVLGSFVAVMLRRDRRSRAAAAGR